MPPPSSPRNESSSVWEISNFVVSDDSLDHDNERNNSREERGSRLNTLNLLSNFILQASGVNDATNRSTWRNRNSFVNDSHLHINEIPIEIRNIGFDSNSEPGVMSDIDNENNFNHDYEDHDYQYLEDEDDDDNDDEDDEGNDDGNDENYNSDNNNNNEANNHDGESDLRSDIESNEILLLSSARQNYTNTNTLISPDDSSHGPLPLRRQNAIRSRSRDSHRQDSNLWFKINNEAKAYHKDISKLLEVLGSLSVSSGLSPVFKDHSAFHRHCNRLDTESNENIFSSLDLVMDRFISKRKCGLLWQPVKRMNSERHQRTVSNKRKLSSFPFYRESKKQKTKAHGSEASAKYSKAPDGRLNLKSLASSDKCKILDILFSSFLKNGATFSLGSSGRFSDTNLMDLVFTSVDYKAKELDGFFTISVGEKSPVSMFYVISRKLQQIKHYFLGTDVNLENSLRSKLLAKKVKILDRLFEDFTLDTFKDLKNRPHRPFMLPFSGKLIDFNQNDLRFLTPINMPSNIRIRSLHLARTKSARVRLQLSEWMKIQPFKSFKQNYFLHKLSKLERDLKSFGRSSANSGLKEEHLEMAKGLKLNAYDLTKDFDFVKDKKVPIPFFENEQIKREFAVSGFKSNFFVQDWQRGLSDKLTEFVTCQEDCLLNIQSNYILFTLTVDLNSLIDRLVEYVLIFSTQELVIEYQSIMKNLVDKSSDSDYKNSVLLCSLNRKTGSIEVQNTRAYLDYKNVYQADLQTSRGNSRGSGLFSGPTNDYESRQNVNLSNVLSSDDSDSDDGLNLRRRYVNPYDEELTTTLMGSVKRKDGNSSLGGGNPSHSVA